MLRYVVLEHSWNGIHFDLMLEGSGSLRTWRLSSMLQDVKDDAIELPDHRLDYLTYEGPVTGERGSVRRLASGHFTLEAWSDDRITVQFTGGYCGRLAMTREETGRWRVLWEPDHTTAGQGQAAE